MQRNTFRIIKNTILIIGIFIGINLMLLKEKVQFEYGWIREYSEKHIMWGFIVILITIIIYAILEAAYILWIKKDEE